MEVNLNNIFTPVSAKNEYQIKKNLEKNGLCIINELETIDDFKKTSNSLGDVYRHRDSLSSGITKIAHTDAKNAGRGFSGFTNGSLEFHTDRSCLEKPPTLMMLFAERNSPLGGYSRLVDGKHLIELLYKHDDRSTLDFLTSPGQAIYSDAELTYKGSLLYKRDNGKYGLRFRCDGNGYYSYQNFEKVRKVIEACRDIEHSFILPELNALVIDNERWLHGRTSFVGERSMLRLLVNTGNWYEPGFSISEGINQ
ncbi:hypothetical protein GC090_12665 [Pantoea sp. JZ29]|nr:hypothetical protein NL54_01410 [Pantoea stewartii]KHN62031.1 hypothetical protein OI73_14410 [Pantoea stewartii]WRH21451.1 hypothetical protein GC090_12665 [Pantoea sp. JZ29]